MENQLTALETKIDALLASAESQNTSEGDDQIKASTADKSRMDRGEVKAQPGAETESMCTRPAEQDKK